jgi:heat shock protein HtpX
MRPLNNHLKTIVLLGGLSAVLIGLGGLLGSAYLAGFTLLALGLNIAAYFFSDRLVLRMHHARELPPEDAPRLHGMVAELAMRAEIPQPRVFVIDALHANAFATGRNPGHGVVAVTTGLLQLLSERELRGVLAHEIAHIKNRDILVATIAAALAAAVTYIAHALSFASFLGGAADEGEEGSGTAAQGLLVALVAPLAATVIQLGVSRAREYLADDTGARLAQDPEALGAALEKLARGAELMPAAAEPATASLFIVNPLAGGMNLARLFSTHPPIEDRVRRLRQPAMDLRMGLAE